MATSLVNKASATNKNPSLFRLTFSFVKSFSTSSPSANATSNSSTSKKSKRKKKKNLFEVAQFLPNWGIGYHMAKSHWKDVCYELTKINLYKDGRHGKAWGIAYKHGLPAADAPKKISGVHKRCWRYVPSLSKLSESKPISPTSSNTTETAPKCEVQVA